MWIMLALFFGGLFFALASFVAVAFFLYKWGQQRIKDPYLDVKMPPRRSRYDDAYLN